MSGTTSWLSQLQKPSWRGVPFSVEEDDNQTGRSTAEHAYPFRDQPWIEDLNRAQRRYVIRGFLVGDDVYAQEARMRAAAETPGPGELIHPVYGSRTVNLIEFSTSHTKERGRSVNLSFTFVEGGVPLYPSSNSSTQDQTNTAAASAGDPIGTDYQAAVLNASPPATPVTVTNPNGASTSYGTTYA